MEEIRATKSSAPPSTPDSPEHDRNRQWGYEDRRYPKLQTWSDGFELDAVDKKLVEYGAWYKKMKRQRKI